MPLLQLVERERKGGDVRYPARRARGGVGEESNISYRQGSAAMLKRR